MSISGLSYSGTETTLSLLMERAKSASPARVLSAGNEGSYIPTSPSIFHSVTTDIEDINNLLNNLPDTHAASNSNLLFYSLNTDILSSGDLSGVQSTITNYTESFSSLNESTNPWNTPSTQFLSDLKAIGEAAASGDVAVATSALVAAKNDSPSNAPSGKTAAELTLQSNANIRDGLVAEGYSLSDATAEADAITIGGLVGTTSDPKVNKKRDDEISDLARVLSMEAGSTDKNKVEASSAALADIVNQLLGATSTDAANLTLASLDKVYGTSQGPSIQG